MKVAADVAQPVLLNRALLNRRIVNAISYMRSNSSVSTYAHRLSVLLMGGAAAAS